MLVTPMALNGHFHLHCYPRLRQIMAEVKPDLVSVTVPGVGHAPLLEHPQVEQAIDDFLAHIDGQA